MGRHEVYRRRWLIAYSTVLFGVFEAVSIMGVISTAQAGLWPGVVIFSVLMLGMTTTIVAFARVAVVATPSDLIVRDYIRTTKVAWADIDRICLSGEDSEREVTVVLRDGGRLRPVAFEGTRGSRPPKSADAFAQRLQERLSPQG